MNPVSKYFRPGQFLFREGEPSHSMFLIKKGTISVRKMKGPAYVEIARAYSNEVIGELSFFDRQPRSAAAVALTEVEVLEIDFEALGKIYEKVPDYMKTIIGCLADRLRKADDTIRRLQKEVIKEGEMAPTGDKDAPSATDVLAATTNAPHSAKPGSEAEKAAATAAGASVPASAPVPSSDQKKK